MRTAEPTMMVAGKLPTPVTSGALTTSEAVIALAI
jgi:hypothetical protein